MKQGPPPPRSSTDGRTEWKQGGPDGRLLPASSVMIRESERLRASRYDHGGRHRAYWRYRRPDSDIRMKGGRIPWFRHAGAIVLKRGRFKVLTSERGEYFVGLLRRSMGYVESINRTMRPVESGGGRYRATARSTPQAQVRRETNGANVSMATGEISIAPDYNPKSRFLLYL